MTGVGLPRVDSVQTLASLYSFATANASSSYVDNVRYYRNCSYEMQAGVATSRASRIEIQPSTSMSGRLYCTSCRRHRRRRDFRGTSSNCTSCLYTLDILQLRKETRPWIPPAQIIGGHKDPQKTTMIHILIVRTDLIRLEEAIGVFYQSFLVQSRRQII